MGDHRVSIKIEFEMHGHKNKFDAWLNWRDALPQEAAEWIQEQKEIAMDLWFAAHEDAELRIRAEAENWEREELARLKAKYDAPDA